MQIFGQLDNTCFLLVCFLVSVTALYPSGWTSFGTLGFGPLGFLYGNEFRFMVR